MLSKRVSPGAYAKNQPITLADVPSRDSEGEYTEEFRLSLFRSLLDLKRGRCYSLKEVEEELML
jgi:hypothetical protein